MDTRIIRDKIFRSARHYMPKYMNPEERDEYLRAVVVVYIANLISIPYVGFFFLWDHPVARIQLPASMLSVVAFSTILFWTRKGKIRIANFQIAMASFAGIVMASICLGRAVGLHLYLLLISGGIVLIHPKRSRWLAIIYGLLSFGIFLLLDLNLPDSPLLGPDFDSKIIRFSNTMTLAVAYLFVLGISCWYVFQTDRTAAALAREKERSENLLLNILPHPIAQRLMDSHDQIADGFEIATVLFADIVNFCGISGKMAPLDVVGYLNEIFTAFDKMTHELGLEKIKTIGDAYMVAGGIPQARPDHAEAVIELAIGMLQYAQSKTAPNGEPLAIRIGVNSGPVIAGVIGTKKFIYDLWGDTVNLASRLESQGLENQIQVSEASYQLLKDTFEFEKRENLFLKGMGPTSTWLLKIPATVFTYKLSS